MKKKDLIKFREKSQKELQKAVDEKKLELLKVSANIKVAKEKNLKKASNLRHDIAQLMTIGRENELIEETQKKKNPIASGEKAD